MKRTRHSPRPDRHGKVRNKYWHMRHSCVLTQGQMADLLGCSVDTVYRIESTRRKIPMRYVYAYKAIAAERGTKIKGLTE